MRFLCLHGIGSNSRIFEQQTAAIRYELGDGHTFDFVEGTVPWENEDLKGILMEGEECFTYCDPVDPASCLQAARQLEQYIESEGPYDGVIGFSMGANMAASHLIQKERESQAGSNTAPPFKVAILFSNARPPCDYAELHGGTFSYLDAAELSSPVNVASAHLWGSGDVDAQASEAMGGFFAPDRRFTYVHEKGHEIPSGPGSVIAIAKVIKRAIALGSA